jgi:hypothetical protein
MTGTIRRLISSGVLLCVVAASAGDRSASPTASAKPIAASPTQVSYHYIEVRLRRLHLARPDLILYPIAYEVIC